MQRKQPKPLLFVAQAQISKCPCGNVIPYGQRRCKHHTSLGHKWSAEARRIKSVTTKGRINKGHLSGNWTGDDPKYKTLLKWVINNKPRSEYCDHCNNHLNSYRGLWARKVKEGKNRDVDNWEYWCIKCVMNDPSTRKNMSVAQKEYFKNHKSWNLGKHLSEATKKKISDKNKGKTSYWKDKKIPEQFRKKMSLARIGMKLSEEHKKNMSLARLGVLHHKGHGPCIDCGSKTTYMTKVRRSGIIREDWIIADKQNDKWRCKKCANHLEYMNNRGERLAKSKEYRRLNQRLKRYQRNCDICGKYFVSMNMRTWCCSPECKKVRERKLDLACYHLRKNAQNKTK